MFLVVLEVFPLSGIQGTVGGLNGGEVYVRCPIVVCGVSGLKGEFLWGDLHATWVFVGVKGWVPQDAIGQVDIGSWDLVGCPLSE